MTLNEIIGEVIFISLAIAAFAFVITPIKILLDFIDNKYEK